MDYSSALRIGADPELFLKLNNKPVSAHKYLKGTKKEPFPVKQGAVQVDGMAAEFNINPAATSKEFIHNIQTVMKELKLMLPKKIKLDIKAVAHFSHQYMAHVPETAKELGCDPDFDAYTLKANPRPDQHSTMRTAAGHVHLGWTNVKDPHSSEHFALCAHMVRQLDCVLGIWSVLNDPDKERKAMYGKAGAFRPKPYGLEYRVMSNFWLKDPKLMFKVFEMSRMAFLDLAVRGIDYSKEFFDMTEEDSGWTVDNGILDIPSVINDNNAEGAEVVWEAMNFDMQYDWELETQWSRQNVK